ncbi:hypothetical protein ACRAWD_08520 [Caulobacter segnis]
MRLIVQLLSLFLRGTALMLGLVGAGMGDRLSGRGLNDRLTPATHAAPAVGCPAGFRAPSCWGGLRAASGALG